MPSSWETPVILTVHDVPPSLNRTGGRGHWSGFHRAKKAWQRDLSTLLLCDWPKDGQRIPASFVWADALLRFPVRRGRDEGNFRSLLEKALGDALQVVAILPDDTPTFFRFGQLGFEPEPGPPLTRIRLAWKRGDA